MTITKENFTKMVPKIQEIIELGFEFKLVDKKNNLEIDNFELDNLIRIRDNAFKKIGKTDKISKKNEKINKKSEKKSEKKYSKKELEDFFSDENIEIYDEGYGIKFKKGVPASVLIKSFNEFV